MTARDYELPSGWRISREVQEDLKLLITTHWQKHYDCTLREYIVAVHVEQAEVKGKPICISDLHYLTDFAMSTVSSIVEKFVRIGMFTTTTREGRKWVKYTPLAWEARNAEMRELHQKLVDYGLTELPGPPEPTP